MARRRGWSSRAAGRCSTSTSVAQLAQPFRRLGAERTGSQNGHGLGPLDRRSGRRRARRRARAPRPPARRPARADHPASRHTSARALGAGMRVLVVEDEPEFANLIAEGLRDQGMAVDIAYDGLAGAAKLNLNPYDVVVLDRDLPGLHGDTLCRMITDSDEPGDDPDADRRRHPGRARRRARARRRRLPPQTVPLPRARAPDPRARPPQTRPPSTAPSQPRASSSTRSHRHRHPRRPHDSTSPPRNSPCSKPC